MRLPLCPCCCSSATSKGFFLFPLQFCRFFCPFCKILRIFRQKAKNTRVPILGTLVQYITLPCPVAAGYAASSAPNRLSTPVRKKCIFSRKKFVQPVRSVLVRTCTAHFEEINRFIVCILLICTPYELYRLFELRTRFLQMRTEQSSSHCANLIVILPQETFPPRRVLEEPTTLCRPQG